jgi:glucokinase
MTTAVAIGIDIGGTRLRTAAVAADGTVLDRRRRETPASDEASLLEAIEDEVDAIGGVLPVGIGIAGLVAPDGVVRYGPNIGVRDLALAARLGDRLSRPVTVVNDASAAAFGEQRAGAGQGRRDVLLFTLGTGVGGGVVLGGELLVGAGGFAGELGHVIVERDGRACPCGNRGCVEAYASGKAIGRLATERLAASDRPSGLRELTSVGGSAVSRAAAEGDPLAQELLLEAGEWLGVAMASCVNALDPELILVGGGAAKGVAPFALPAMRDTLAQLVIGHHFRVAPPVQLAALGDDAGTVGAALYAVDRTTTGEGPP